MPATSSRLQSGRRRVVVAVLVALFALATAALGDAPGDPRFGPDAEEPASAETIAARQRFFGAENVHARTGALPRDEVHVSWVSVTTFAAALDGHVVLFDAYIHKEEDGKRNYVPATTQDLIDLKPEAIYIGHGHYDHALLSGEIAAATGATIVGTRSHCDQAAAQAGAPVPCVVAFEPGAAPGATADVDLLPGVCTTAVLHLHSGAEPPDPEHDHTNVVAPVPDAGRLLLHPPGPSATLVGPGDEGGTVLYQFRIGDFSLVFNDSAGPLKENAPEVYDVFRSMPQTDVQLGAIIGFNNFTNGLRDHAQYVAAFDPQVFVPNHHDFVFEYGAGDEIEEPLRRDFAFYGTDPEVRWLHDPFDYARPNLLRFDVNDDRWAEAGDLPCAGNQRG
jgi:L-ascorbate metabolism protein UlaG (beta-lactamase superfamily)